MSLGVRELLSGLMTDQKERRTRWQLNEFNIRPQRLGPRRRLKLLRRRPLPQLPPLHRSRGGAAGLVKPKQDNEN
jgi:hypothetical protein